MNPQQRSGDRAATKTEDDDHRHSDLYGREPEDVQRWIATVTPGTASYRGGSRTRAITTGAATYMGGGGSQATKAVTTDTAV